MVNVIEFDWLESILRRGPRADHFVGVLMALEVVINSKDAI